VTYSLVYHQGVLVGLSIQDYKFKSLSPFSDDTDVSNFMMTLKQAIHAPYM